MGDVLTLAVCNFLVPEISEIISNGDYPDVKLISYAASCSANSGARKSIENNIKRFELEQSDLIVIGSTCIDSVNEISVNYNYRFINLKQCFEPILNNETIFYYISKGYYIVTNGWLKKLDQHKEGWGFDNKEDSNKFFRESMRKILFLDTKIPGDYEKTLDELSEYMGIPYEILPVGLETCKLFLDNIIKDWRIEKERKALNKRLSQISQKSSDLLVIFNQLEKLVDITREDMIIDVAFDLINILFAPQNIKYTKYVDGNFQVLYYSQNFELQQVKPENSFRFDIYHTQELFGIIEVIGIRFPEHIHKYEEMARVISQILAISIANARKYSQIISQKDQIEHYSKELKKSNITKDKFFQIIAHDLKGPFSALLGFSEFLIEDIERKKFDRLDHFAKIINQNLNDTFNLLVNLLEWARTQLDKIKFEPESIKVKEAISDVRNHLISQADSKDVFINVDIPEDLEITADANMFKTIFRNLISNAIKYSNPKGIIKVSSEIKDNFMQFSVADQGIGMQKETLDDLFSIEFNESNPGTSCEKGTGLGLTICKEFIDAHNGRIWVESEQGKGSTFYLYFPD